MHISLRGHLWYFSLMVWVVYICPSGLVNSQWGLDIPTYTPPPPPKKNLKTNIIIMRKKGWKYNCTLIWCYMITTCISCDWIHKQEIKIKVISLETLKLDPNLQRTRNPWTELSGSADWIHIVTLCKWQANHTNE